MKNKLNFNILIALTAMLIFSCVRSVTRVNENKQIDLSGRWNDTDSKLVSEEMIADVLARPWLTEFVETKGKKPTVIIGLVQNKSHEHISTETFIKDMERAFVNTGKVRVVQDAEAREQLRKERADQNEYSSVETAKKWGKEKGADYMLQGTLNSIVDASGGKSVVFYQADLELTDMETNEKVWIGTKKIKKFVQN